MRRMEGHMDTNAARTLRRLRGVGSLAAKLCLAALSTVGIGVAATSCSLIVDTNSEQCAADTDCKGELAGRVCKEGLCVAPEDPPCTSDLDCVGGATDRACKDGTCVDVVCVKNQTCANKNGPNSVCRKNDCVSLTTDLCQTVYATKANPQDAYLDENAFFIGAILPAEAYDPIGPVIEKAIKLALDDFGKVNGLPAVTGTGKRPMVLVGCNDGENGDKGVDAANHLIDTLGIQAIVGYAFSGTTIQLATDVTIPKGVLLFSPSATSDDITQIADNDLLWRTSPRDSLQSAALSQYYPEVEARARGLFPMIPANNIKVAIISNNDSYGVGLADGLQGQLMFNGKSALSQKDTNYKRFDYGDPGAPNLGIVAQVAAFSPHVIFVFGFNEGVDPVFTSIESSFGSPADGHMPLWVFSDAGNVSDLWDKAITTEEQRQRISGSSPGVLKDKYLPYSTFLATWDASPHIPAVDTLGPAGAYDITYLFAYSAVAVGQDPPTGANLAKKGLRKMTPPPAMPVVTVGRPGINDAFQKLQAGVAFNFEGASGPLDFDEFGEAQSDIQIWCVPPGAGKPASPSISSGRFYSASEKKMDGAFDVKCALP
jgi:branched-chain amino acid transport system substrate-binding protein